MKKFICLIGIFLVFVTHALAAENYESLELINKTNLPAYFNDYLGYVYDSHGCLHFTPSDIYLLYRTIPPELPLAIKTYKAKPLFNINEVPYLNNLIKDEAGIKETIETFRFKPTYLVVYPSLDRLIIMVDSKPYAQVKALAGPKEDYYIAFDVKKGGAISWDFMLTTPTDPGQYKILRSTDHYLSSAYYQNTIVPFGAWIIKKNGLWLYQDNKKWYKLPSHIITDLNKAPQTRLYNYYDVNVDQSGQVVAARYAGHDFGKYVMLWTQDGKNHYPEMAYAAGELLYEQIILVKDLVDILTMPGDDNFDRLISQNKNFSFYRDLPNNLDQESLAYYKLYLGQAVNQQLLDPRVVKAFREYQENRLPRNKAARRKALGLVYYLRLNYEVIKKQKYWYEKLKSDWDFWRALRIKLRADFDKMGIYALANRQNVVEQWLSERLEFKAATLPKLAKNVRELSFGSFFKPKEHISVFSQRERELMLEKVRKAISGEGQALELYSVKALNDYNFGLLLNDILGDLYKSHGCLHVAPRSMYFLYELLPVGTQIKVYDYGKQVDPKTLEAIPFLTDLVNFADDLEKLKTKFSNKSEVKVTVYPSSGIWLVYVKDKPLAKLWVRGGPKAKFYLVQGRKEDGSPIFEDHLAYPTTPGTFYVLKKTEHYISNLYRDTTLMAMGQVLKKQGDDWFYQKNKSWVRVPATIQKDLQSSPKERVHNYYDPVKNASGEVVEVRWGSHPFGRYAIQTTRDGQNPWPELIHSSGDLMMEERSLISDIIKVMAAPFDQLEDCVPYSANFDLYKICYDYVKEPTREDLIQASERAAYKLYHGMPLTSAEVKALPPDAIVADKYSRGQKLTDQDLRLLIKEGVAYRRGGQIKINREKILGIQFDTYQYVVMIQKYAHHYEVLQKHWAELSNLRKALLKDFNNFVIEDPEIFHAFMRELMIRRTQLKKLTQKGAMGILLGIIH